MQTPTRKIWVLILCGLMVCVGSVAQAVPAEKLEIPVTQFSNSPRPLVAYQFTPTSAPPHPAVVMLHGCGGMYDNRGEMGARHRMWGEYLASQGYVALMVDSFTPRELRQVCTTKFNERSIKEADRAGDAYAALAWLGQQTGVDATRISLIGWSHGGGVTLHAISQPPAASPRFKAAIAFYPGCTARSKHADAFKPYAPLLVLMGESDDWTPAAPCQTLTDAVAKRGEPMRIVLYPDTYHDFDNPRLKGLQVRKEVPNGVHPGEGVTVAPNAQAREDAMRRVADFLAAAPR
ncbi:MAG: dienelactone hydrolase [Burkholderiales bacterium PBB4]|nr:MAG: dienelactone hydrolase [Burkholderiales bacterium PBB4]